MPGSGRPDSTDPEVVSSYVLSKFREPPEEVGELIERAAAEAERLVERIAAGERPGGAIVSGNEAPVGYEVATTASRCCGWSVPRHGTRSTRRCWSSCWRGWRRPATTSRCGSLVVSSSDHMGLSAGADVKEQLDEQGKVDRMQLFADLYDAITGLPEADDRGLPW